MYKIRVGWPGPCTPRIQVGPQRVTHRSTLVIHRVLTGSISRVTLIAGMDISFTDGTRVRVGAPQSIIKKLDINVLIIIDGNSPPFRPPFG